MAPWMKLAGGVAGASVAIAGASGLLARRRAGAVRNTEAPELDALLVAPTDVAHRTLQRPDGARVAHVDTEPGSTKPTVVLLHGITLNWTLWSAVIRLLRDDFRVIAWDMRGFGASSAGSCGATIEAASEDLAALLETADVRSAVVVGHSMGGMVLARFAATQRSTLQDRVKGLVFLSTTAKSNDGTLRTGGMTKLSSSAARFAGAGVVNAYGWGNTDLSIALLRRGFGAVATSKMVEDLRVCQASAAPASMVDGLHSIARHDVLDSLRDVTTPAVAMVGDRDALTPVLHARAIVSTMSNARLEVLPGVGHQSLQEAPHAISATVRELSGAL